jgi:hypothetical protein
MDTDRQIAEPSVGQIYARAVSSGASIHVAFDLACKNYQAAHPELHGVGLREAVAAEIGLPRDEAIMIEIGAFT